MTSSLGLSERQHGCAVRMGGGLAWAGTWGRWGEEPQEVELKVRPQTMGKCSEYRAREKRLDAIVGHGSGRDLRKSEQLD